MGNKERDDNLPAGRSSRSEIDAFLNKVAATPLQRPAGRRGRLLFAIDATASREPTWDLACQIQSEMFSATDGIGGLEVQLAFYRGFGEMKVTKWLDSGDELVRRMVKVRCLAGRTQIRKLLNHALRETGNQKVDALVFVGDVVEEDIDELGHIAGQLGLVGTPVFVFHEGGEPVSRRAFEQIARLSGGAYCSFDAGSAQQLKELLAAVAVFSAGGRRALEDLSKQRGGRVLQIADQMRGKR
ncbi:MAG: VWA domain-containing protein [Alphaproteobacteria bacterium]|nr:VWA domain-containing protein [Alphaproteobacteria bacterium]